MPHNLPSPNWDETDSFGDNQDVVELIGPALIVYGQIVVGAVVIEGDAVAGAVLRAEGLEHEAVSAALLRGVGGIPVRRVEIAAQEQRRARLGERSQKVITDLSHLAIAD